VATALQSQQSSRQHRRQHQAPHAAGCTTTARHTQPLLHRAAFAYLLYEHAACYDNNIIVDTAVVVHAFNRILHRTSRYNIVAGRFITIIIIIIIIII